mgnify:FL=1
MKTDTPRPIHLKDYRPPDFLIDNVDLTIALHPTRTRVDARLAIRRNPASKNCDAPLRLDGEHLELSRIALAGDELRAEGYLVDDKGLR